MKRLQRAMGTRRPCLAQSEVSEKGDGDGVYRSQMVAEDPWSPVSREETSIQ